MNPPGYFDHSTRAVRVVFGNGSSGRLRELAEAAGARRVMVVCGPAERDLAGRLAEPLGPLVAGWFSEARPHVPVDVARRAGEAALGCGADWVLSVGGGSTTGTAKAVALELGLPIMAVATTYAGSEMTPVWGLTEGARKTTGRSAVVAPRVVVYDPELTVGLPAGVTATSALNALAHCAEAFYAPGTSPIAALLAEEGIRALVAGAPEAVAHPDELPGRALTLYGAHLAGAAFATAGSDLHHKICHVLGGALDLPHAETHTVVLPQVLAFVEPALPEEARRRLRKALGAQDGEPAGAAVFDLATSLGAPTALSDLGMSPEDVGPLIGPILEQVPDSTPRPPGAEGVRTILEGALEGRSPR
jgi:alcohol dehydrogenase class IV